MHALWPGIIGIAVLIALGALVRYWWRRRRTRPADAADPS
jgi:hypothetical protein